MSPTSNGSPTATTLVGDNDSDLTLDFGYVTPCDAAIGNFVWLDQDRDGVQDPGEPGIQGVRVELLDGNGNFITFTATDANGFYLFSGLCGANYKVKVPTPQCDGTIGDCRTTSHLTRRSTSAFISRRRWATSYGTTSTPMVSRTTESPVSPTFP